MFKVVQQVCLKTLNDFGSSVNINDDYTRVLYPLVLILIFYRKRILSEFDKIKKLKHNDYYINITPFRVCDDYSTSLYAFKDYTFANYISFNRYGAEERLKITCNSWQKVGKTIL